MRGPVDRAARLGGAYWQALKVAARPRSFMHLLVLGFLMVVFPLSGAFLISSLQVKQLADQTQQAVYRAVQSAQVARLLVGQLESMERLARQYVVRGDAARLQAYMDLRPDFLNLLARQQEAMEKEPQWRDRIEQMRSLEHRMQETMQVLSPGSEDVKTALREFSALKTGAAELLRLANQSIDREVVRMRRMGEASQRTLFWYALALIPLALLLAVVFFVLIARPVRQIDEAIRRLGDGDLARVVEVRGPRDLEDLGGRLDWLRTRLEEVGEQKSRFLRHVSHELKTPLTAIREGAELLASEVIGPLNAQQGAAARILQQNALRLQKLIEDLLAFSRLPEIRAQEMSRDTVPLDELIVAVVEDYQLSIQRKRLALHLALEPLSVEGDRLKLRTVIDNLLSNAVKYTPEGERIHLELSSEGGAARFDVRDSGSGIEEEDQARVFDPFYQARVQPPGPVRGTGLGLSIARECARLHGGDIVLMDPGAAGGAHFRFVIPARRGGVQPDAAPADGAPAIGLREMA